MPWGCSWMDLGVHLSSLPGSRRFLLAGTARLCYRSTKIYRLVCNHSFLRPLMPAHSSQAPSLHSLLMFRYFLSVPQISHTDGCFRIQVFFQTIAISSDVLHLQLSSSPFASHQRHPPIPSDLAPLPPKHLNVHTTGRTTAREHRHCTPWAPCVAGLNYCRSSRALACWEKLYCSPIPCHYHPPHPVLPATMTCLQALSLHPPMNLAPHIHPCHCIHV